jgi:hypothetical protein
VIDPGATRVGNQPNLEGERSMPSSTTGEDSRRTGQPAVEPSDEPGAALNSSGPDGDEAANGEAATAHPPVAQLPVRPIVPPPNLTPAQLQQWAAESASRRMLFGSGN